MMKQIAILLAILCCTVQCKQHLHAKQWAVLVAGSMGYENYRHQADICHAYQILRRGGLEDANIIVFMYDDIATNTQNPRQGMIINKPGGDDVYHGVPKDYTGNNATANNLLAVIMGNRTALTGGSGKVLDSGPADHVFIFYSDHGSPGLIGMPLDGDNVYADELIYVLKKKHQTKTYAKMVFYLDSCEGGSIFEGILPNNISIYAVTASASQEDSWATYCPADNPDVASEFDTCLGDAFSVSWMEDSDLHDPRIETLSQQYKTVRRRVAHSNYSSHVTQYGNTTLSKDLMYLYVGSNSSKERNTNFFTSTKYKPSPRTVNQRDASLVYFENKFRRAPEGSSEKVEAGKKMTEEISDRRRTDLNIKQIGAILFDDSNASPDIMTYVRPSGQPLVDDWYCFKMLVTAYEKHCGRLSWYGKKYTRVMANMCNAGVTVAQMTEASIRTCSMKK